jgi:RNA polymerase sigma-70 factor (ECF subfamily)
MAETETADKELIAAYLAGDARSFELLYERYRRPLFSYLNKMMPGQTTNVDDIFQKAWMKAIRNLNRYQDKQTFFSWIVRIAHNTAIDSFRRESRRPTVGEDVQEMEIDSETDAPWQAMSDEELHRAVNEAVAELPPEQREVFILRREGVSFKEIAELQDCSVNTALGRMHYATNRLKQLLQEWR